MPPASKEVVLSPADGSPEFLPGKERDPESGLDDFSARFYGSWTGRFTSPDDPFVGWNLADPQSLNLYAYVQDNPINDVDPTGHECSIQDGASLIGCTFNSEMSAIGANIPIEGVSTPTHALFKAAPDPEGIAANTKVTSAANSHETQTPQGQNSGSNATPSPPSTPPATTPTTPTCLCANAQNGGNKPAPTNPDGTPKAPNIPAPTDKSGKPTTWVPKPGSGPKPGVRWVPSPPVPSPDGRGGQPQVVWDPEDGYWTHDNGGGERTHWDENTGRQVVKATAVGVGAIGTAVIIWKVAEVAGAVALAF